MAAQRSAMVGAAEISKVMKKLPATMSEKVLVTALRAGARPIVKEARALVPRRTGELRKSITVRKPNKKQRRLGAGLIVIGFKTPTSRRAHLTEFGTSTTAAHPFMRPAVDNKRDEFLAAVAAKLGVAIERAAKKLAGSLTRKQRRALFR